MSPDVAASVKARLLAKAKATGEEFERTLTRFAAERLLYRLGASMAGERCLLKGASLLAVWLPDPYRATRDVDVLASGSTSDRAIRAMLEAICAVPCPEDGLQFDLSELRLDVIRPEDEYSGKRARFRARLGSARIVVQLDLGFGDAVTPHPDDIEYPTMLERLPAPRLRGYPREATIAEKFEAMVSLGTRNSRMKDFHDLWALANALDFDGPALSEAILACFQRRGTPWTAESLQPLTQTFYRIPELAARWASYLTAGAVLIPPPARFEEIGEGIMLFLGPLRDRVVAGGGFDGHWTAPGPWTTRAASRPG